MLQLLPSVPYVDLALQHASIKAELMEAIEEVLDEGQFILGPQVLEFERQIAKIVGTKEAVALNSGTDALILALKSLGIGSGDEVITVPNSFVASASCIALVGATPVFIDVSEDYNLNPALLEEALTPRTKAILPVHLTGKPADMTPILQFAQKHNLFVVEDCAQAILAEYNGQQVGSFGIAGCFSLHPLKTLNACGDGGILTTDDPALASQVRLYRNLGLKTRENCTHWSSNSRLDTIQAAILLVKLRHLHRWTEQRRAHAVRYQRELANIPGLRVPLELAHEKCVYHTFVVLAERREALRVFLQERGIGTAIHYPTPIHHQDVAHAYAHLKFPVTERLAEQILSLPIHQDLKPEQQTSVIEAIHAFYSGFSR